MERVESKCVEPGEKETKVWGAFLPPHPPSTEGFSVEERVQARHNILFIPNHSTYHSFYQHSIDFFLKKQYTQISIYYSFFLEGGGGGGVKVKVILTHKI